MLHNCRSTSLSEMTKWGTSDSITLGHQPRELCPRQETITEKTKSKEITTQQKKKLKTEEQCSLCEFDTLLLTPKNCKLLADRASV